MIMRVSNLQETTPEMRIYIDPESMRKNKQLQFEQVWVVKDSGE